MTYQLIRSNRRTMAIELGPRGLLVRVPFGTPQERIDAFVRSQEDWIRRHLEKREKALAAQAAAVKLTPEEIRELAEQAVKVIPARVAFYAPLIGVTCNGITIRCQRTRWGSCSTKGNLNFNCLLMLAPPEVLDSVVVHELCHRKEMNHSKRFYAEVLRVFPDYRKWNRWLKENGAALLNRLP